MENPLVSKLGSENSWVNFLWHVLQLEFGASLHPSHHSKFQAKTRSITLSFLNLGGQLGVNADFTAFWRKPQETTVLLEQLFTIFRK